MAKPNRDIYEYFLNKFNLNGSDCLFIDDNINNVNAAIKVGINAVELKNIDYMHTVLEENIK